MLSATYSGRRTVLAILGLVFGASAWAETKTITIKTKPGDPNTFTSVKILKNNGNMTIDAPGCTVAGPAAGATGTWQLTDCTLADGSPLTITLENPDGTVNYRLGGYDYSDANGNPVWVGGCGDPIAFRVIEGGALGAAYLGYSIPPGEYGYFYQMFSNNMHPETVQHADVYVGPNNGAYNFQVLSNSFKHLPDPGFDLSDLQVPLRDPPDGYEYEIVRYMEPEDATGLPGIPTSWAYDGAALTATMDFTDAPGGGLSPGQTGSIVAYTSPYHPTMLLDNVDFAYAGEVEPPCTGTLVNEAPVPVAPPQFSFQPLPELPGGASEVFGLMVLTPTLFKPNPTAVLSGRALDDDGLWKAVLWGPGSEPFGWPPVIQALPNPFGITGSQASGISCAVNFADVFCSIGGAADNLGGVPQPVVWMRDGEGPWATEVPPLPPGYDSGMVTAIAIDVAIISLSGWVDQADGPEPRHAARWTKDLDSGLWTVELLPDNGPGFYSEAHAIFRNDTTNMDDCLGGHVQADGGFGHLPCVWEEPTPGVFDRLDLLMTDGSYKGSVESFSTLDNDTGAIDFVRWSIGYEAAIGGLGDLHRGAVWTQGADGWSASLPLSPLPSRRDARASGSAGGRAGGRDGVTVVGHSFTELSPGSGRATMWELSNDNSVSRFDLHDLTVDLPPAVTLGGIGELVPDGLPMLAGRLYQPGAAHWGTVVAGTHANVDSPGAPHANVLVELSGEDCNKNFEDDAIDLYTGGSADINGNGVPDECEALPSAPQSEPAGITKNRFVSFVVPATGAGADTAIRVELTSLHHPAGPPNAPNFSAFEGQYRYLNAIRDAGNNPVFVCPDSTAFGTSYNCAKLGCAPEYRDWAGIFGGAVVHVTGDSVVPSSQYAVSQLAASCVGNEATCAAASAELTVSTERWGNVDNTPPGAAPNAIDISKVVDKVKNIPSAFIEPRCQLREATPNPYAFAVNAQDIGRIVDAVKGQAYPFPISACP